MKLLLKRILLVFAAIILIITLLLSYAYFIEPRQFVITEKTISVQNWTSEANDFKIVAISDIHGGSHYMDDARIKFVVEQANAQDADIIVLLGDFVSEVGGKSSALRMPMSVIADNLQGLKTRYGVYAVIGNHDWWHDEREVRRELERIGYTVLENEAASFDKNGQTIAIIGIEDFWKRRKVDIEKVLANINPRRNIIAITHNPDSFDQLPDGISILLAGHTHGGQVVLPFIGAPVVVAKREYLRGHIEKNGKNLFVTTGYATTFPFIRLSVPPEISVLNLTVKN